MPSPRFTVYESNRTIHSPDAPVEQEVSSDQSLTGDTPQNVSLGAKLFEHYVLRNVVDRLRALISINSRRSLAAVMYADVADYSRLMQEDEQGTHDLLIRSLDFVAHCVRKEHGKIAHYAGDAVMADFRDASSALHCAVCIQQGIEQCNADLPPENCIRFRIGINLGEIIHDRGDIYGNAVNVAARLEGLAIPGGICITDAVRISVGNQPALDYVPLGDLTVKNISEPLRAYHVAGSGLQAASPPLNLDQGA